MTPRERAREVATGSGGSLPYTHRLSLTGEVEAAILAALAERDAGEAERVREAVAAEREACAQACEGWTTTTVGDQYAHGCAARIRARATSAPAAVPHPASREACEAARAERAQGRDIYADGEGRCEVAPEPVAAERAERCSACGRPTTVGEDFGGPCVYASDAACAERAVVEAAEAWHACLSAKRATGSVLCPPGKSCGAALEAAVDALAAARKGGAK